MKTFSEFVTEAKAKDSYDLFFKKAMEKWGIDSPEDLESEEEKKKFFDYVDKSWKADDEE